MMCVIRCVNHLVVCLKLQPSGCNAQLFKWVEKCNTTCSIILWIYSCYCEITLVLLSPGVENLF